MTDEITEAILRELGIDWLETFHEQLWEDPLDQKSRSPDFRQRQRVPQFVQDVVQEVVEKDFIPSPPDGVEADPDELRDFWKDELDKPIWTIDSISRNYADEFDVNEGWARKNTRDTLHEILMHARIRGYESGGGVTNDHMAIREFRWVGPDDDSTSRACEWIKAQTRDGVRLTELKRLIGEAKHRFVDDPPDDPMRPHDWCRHQMKEYTR